MSEAVVDDIVAVLPPLLQSLEALGFIARHLNPPDFDRIMEAAGAPDQALQAVRPRLVDWPEPFAGIQDSLQAAADGALAAFAGLRAVQHGNGDLVAVFRALRHAPRAQEALYPLAAKLPPAVREVAILVTGAHFRSAYELYAHVIVAEHRGLSDEKLASIVAGQRPVDLTRQEAVAYDVASALVGGGVLPELTYRAAVEQFGQHGAAELSYLVGLYCLVSVTLNTFDVPVPETDR